MKEEILYFLPKTLESAFACLDAEGLTAVERIVEIEGFKFPGLVISGPEEKLEHFARTARVPEGGPRARLLTNLEKIYGSRLVFDEKIELCGETVVDDKMCHVLGLEGVVANLPEYGWGLDKHTELLDEINSTLADISAWAGKPVLLAAPSEVVVGLPLIPETQICVILDSSPAGHYSEMRSKKLCGVSFSEIDEGIRHSGPTAGRGYVVRDEDGTAVAQIIRNCFYLFLPYDVLHKRMVLTQGGNGLGLFRKTLMRAWNAQFEARDPQIEVFESAEAYVAFGRETVQEAPRILRALVDAHDKKIAEAEEKLRNAISEKRRMLRLIEHLEREASELTPEKLKQSWNKLTQLPQVRSIASVDNALQVETNLLVNTQYGRRPLGRYILRLAEQQIFVWCIESCHPAGLSHPHIGVKHGNPCFGNVSIAIQKAASESRAYAIELAIRWLESGYDHDLADIKITEWPEAA